MLPYVHIAYLTFLCVDIPCSDDAVLILSNIVYLGNRWYMNFIFMQILLSW